MGKGGRGKGSSKGGSTTTATSKADEDDDKLLDAMITQNEREKAEIAAAQQATWWGEDGPVPQGGLSKGKPMEPKAIVEKLNAIPTFCLLSGENALLGLKDMTDKTGKRKICAWFTDPNQAADMLSQCKAHSPDIAAGLHLGVTPLGVAYSFACGWVELEFDGDKQVHGTCESGQAEAMREQAVAQGLEARTWHVAVFTCAELATPSRMPFFLSQKALAEAWLVTGRKLADLNGAHVAALDLGVVVHQMQTGAFDGAKVQFVSERRAIALVHETRQADTVSRAEVPPGKEPSREEAVNAIQQALIAQVLAGKGEAEGGAGDVKPPPPAAAATARAAQGAEEPSPEEEVAALQQALIATVLAGKDEPPPLE